MVIGFVMIQLPGTRQSVYRAWRPKDFGEQNRFDGEGTSKLFANQTVGSTGVDATFLTLRNLPEPPALLCVGHTSRVLQGAS